MSIDLEFEKKCFLDACGDEANKLTYRPELNCFDFDKSGLSFDQYVSRYAANNSAWHMWQECAKLKNVIIDDLKSKLDHGNKTIENCLTIIDTGATMKPYEQSNRHKLSLAIKATGFKAKDLSLSAGYKGDYFTDYTSKSRLLVRGDISDDRLNELLTTLAFAERELLGLGAKTVNFEEALDAAEVPKSNFWLWVLFAAIVFGAVIFNYYK